MDEDKENKLRKERCQGLIPAEILTEEDQLKFVKQLTCFIISNVFYARKIIFSEDDFRKIPLDTIDLHLLDSNCESNSIGDIIGWIKGCIEAIDKKYLKTLSIVLYQDGNAVFEEYNLNYSYDKGVGLVNLTLFNGSGSKIIDFINTNNAIQDTKTFFLDLFGQIAVMDPMPKYYSITFMLNYYDEITPYNYEPPNFSHTEEHFYKVKKTSSNKKVTFDN